MTKEQIYEKINKINKGLQNPNLTEGAKANLNKMVRELYEQAKDLEKAEEKKQETIEKKEDKEVENLDETIKKLEAQLKRNPPAAIRAAFEKKLKAAKEKRGDVIEEAKEDKKEAKEEIKEIKEAVKEIKQAVATGRTKPIKKPKIKEKQREERSEKRIKKIKKETDSLQSLVDRIKSLREKYQGKGVDLERDAGRPAKPFGYRFIGKGANAYKKPTKREIIEGKRRGIIDYEGRANRSDKFPQGYKRTNAKLEDGGMMADGGSVCPVCKMKHCSCEKGGSIKRGDIGIINTIGIPYAKGEVLFVGRDSLTVGIPYAKGEVEFVGRGNLPIQGKILTISKESFTPIKESGKKKYKKLEDGGMMAKGGGVFDPMDTPTTFTVYRKELDDKKEVLVLKTKSQNRAVDFVNLSNFLGRKRNYKIVATDKSGNSKIIRNYDEADMMADGGMMAADGGMMAKGGKAKRMPIMDDETEKEIEDAVSESYRKRMPIKYMDDETEKEIEGAVSESYRKRMGEEPKVIRTQFEEESFEYKKGGAVKKKRGRKKSQIKYAWTKDAVKDGIIKKNKLNSTPSLYHRKKYPAYIIEK